MNRQNQWLFEAPPKTPLPKDRVVWGTITRILVVSFRRNFDDFRQEVRKAVGQYMTFRSDRGAYLGNLLASEPTFLRSIQITHINKLQDSSSTEFAPVEIMATFTYTPQFKRVTRITFP